ncbi:MAG: fumarylacetoacetate hydrolase family protein [Cucumibacter sp.]
MAEPIVPQGGVLLGRVRHPDVAHPLVVTVHDGEVFDITGKRAPTVRDVCELADAVSHVETARDRPIGPLDEIAANSRQQTRQPGKPYLLAPVDLQAIKACGVTFVVSLLERVIEEQARGDPGKAKALRGELTGLIGDDLSALEPGSDAAMAVKEALIGRGIWSQYLEVGIGPDPEVFTKGQPLSAVGYGAEVGVLASSKWNNPEPEVVLIVASDLRIVGASLGNDVNLRDIEGRSALLLGKAKDNNASGAIGPFIRLFDGEFTLETVKRAELTMTVEGEDGFAMTGRSSMRQISRPPEALVAATSGAHHQYPDGFALYLGTMFAPVEDRDKAGEGFTHHLGDVVRIACPELGVLQNRVRPATECAPWTYGVRQLMADLSAAQLI